jgi:hypothetical protein
VQSLGITTVIISVAGLPEEYLMQVSKAVFARLDAEGKPADCGFFISARQALCCFHGPTPKVGDVLRGFTVPRSDFARKMYSFVVQTIHPNKDFVVLALSEDQPDSDHHFDMSERAVDLSHTCLRIVIFGMNIPQCNMPGFEADPAHIHLTAKFTEIEEVRRATFGYNAVTRRGDSGSCVVLIKTGQAVGMHLEGVNDVPTGVMDAEIKKRKRKDRIDAGNRTILSEMSSMAKTLTNGGVALKVYPELVALPSAKVPTPVPSPEPDKEAGNNNKRSRIGAT